MHPAPSIIIFSTLSGAGFGLIAALGLGFVPIGTTAFLIAAVVAVALAGAGLVASTFHLGHPERALRALTQWRTSWLSREGVLAALTLAGFGLYVLLALAAGEVSLPVLLLGLLCAALAAATVYATAMIYASLRPVPRWHTWLTPACYLAFSATGGALLAGLFAVLTGEGRGVALMSTALVLLAVAWAFKFAWWTRADRTGRDLHGSTPETATGLGHIGRVKLFERPHTSGNYLTRDLIFVIARRHARVLRRIALALGLGAPAILLLVVFLFTPGASTILLMLAALAFLAGTAVERWLFFAEAEHVVALYYGHQ